MMLPFGGERSEWQEELNRGGAVLARQILETKYVAR